jgi:DNA-binding response OmpR family regulator
MKVLSIESDAATASALGTMLVAYGHEFLNVATGKQGIEQARATPQDIILNSFHLADMAAPELISELRDVARVETPIIVMGPHGDGGQWRQRSECFDAGADNYQPVPFRIEELLGRMQAVTRRPPGRLPIIITIGQLRYDSHSRKFEVGGVEARLTPGERTILEELIRHQGEIITRTRLDESRGADTDSNSICVILSRLRAKLEALDAGTFEIETVRGFGHRLRAI